MASSAAHISVTSGTSVHAPHGHAHNKAHNKTPQTEGSFADLLAGADAAAQEDTARTGTRQTAPSEKATNSEKPASQDQAKNEAATDQGDSRAVAKDSQAETAPMDADGKGAGPVTDGTPEILVASDAANDNALMDVAAAQPQPPQPAPQQPLPALTLTPQPAAPDTTQPVMEGDTAAPQADIATPAISSNAPAKAAPQVPDTQNAQAPEAGGKPAAPETALTAAKDAATDGKTAPGVSDFSKALQETQAGPQDAQPAPANGETAKPTETAAPAAAPKPSPETNTITLAAPAAPTHQAMTPQGAEKLGMMAQTDSPSQPAPNVNQMAVEVAARSQSGAKQFDIRLDPPELGRVEVRLSIDAHGKAEAHLTADQPQTLELLQKDAPALARALRDAGLNVAQDGLNFSLKNQQQQAGGDDASRHGGRGNFHNARTPAESGQPEGGATIRRGLGLLDIKV